MDLGIAGRSAIICASSRGLGRACAQALAREGVHVTLNGRDAGVLADTADAIRAAHGVTVDTVAGDIESEATREALLVTCPEPDILVNNNGGPPPGRFPPNPTRPLGPGGLPWRLRAQLRGLPGPSSWAASGPW